MTTSAKSIDIPDAWSGTETPIDFIVVGAGAAGCPLAARLAERGYVVVVIEMGTRQAPLAPDVRADCTRVPLLHAEATEDPRYSLQYFVKQRDDEAGKPPAPEVFYPRGQGVGGCTNHNAMITICGPNEDWDEIAELTGDPSWSAKSMRAYFQRIEACAYAQPQNRWERWMSWLRRSTGWEGSQHGTDGWLTTTLPDTQFLKADKAMLRVVLQAATTSLRTGLDQVTDWLKFSAAGRVRCAMDPNHWENIQRQRAGVVQIPCAIDRRGQRSSPRDRLLDTQAKCQDRLHILSHVLVTRVELENKTAVGVRVIPRAHIYQADPLAQSGANENDDESILIRCRREVILSAGTFNTPQLLMLSGIGDPDLMAQAADVEVLHELRGVGRNLQDRYEVAIQSTLAKPFASLTGVTLSSQPKLAANDRALTQYLQSLEQSTSNATFVTTAAKRWTFANWTSTTTNSVDNKPGIYSSNGAMVGLLYRSKQEDSIADMFIMALAGQFSGYRVGWSRPEALIPGLDALAPDELAQHRTVSWLVLKARTKNSAGFIRLRSSDPTERPEINFRSFADGDDVSGAPAGASAGQQDLLAMTEGVEFVEEILQAGIDSGDIAEVHFPGRSAEQSIQDWIRHTAWGHHACGSCKLGSDDDELAVVDSRFRVRGLQNLRIVDASVFPRIPGYFIATNIYMLAEKAADVLTEDNQRDPDQLQAAKQYGPSPPVLLSRPATYARQTFPAEFETTESELILARRRAANYNVVTGEAKNWLWRLPTTEAVPANTTQTTTEQTTTEPTGNYPNGALGLAISGGGVRSSTFALGFLQALAGSDLLRRVDLLSTVSGGGYVGTFLGRYFDQLRSLLPADSQGRHSAHAIVAKSLADSRSTQLRWLREHANYLASTGPSEALFNIATFWRNFLSLHFVLGMLFLAIFGLMNAALYWESLQHLLRSSPSLVESLAPIGASLTNHSQAVWWMISEASVWYLLVPIALSYWLVSQDRQGRVILPVLAIYGLLAMALTFVLRSALPMGIFMATMFVIVWVARRVQQQIGSADPESVHRRLLARHWLTQKLGTASVVVLVLIVLGLINAAGHFLSQSLLIEELSWQELLARVALLVAPFLAAAPLVRGFAGLLAAQKPGGTSWLTRLLKVPFLFTGLIVLLGTVLPLSIVAFATHAAYGNGGNYYGGLAATLLAIVVSILLGTRSARPFVNRSGPLALYAARLSRVFLGAVNPVRHREAYESDVTALIAGDDVDHDQYKPHLAGGPLHLFNVAVNETVDVVSQRGQRDRQGENMAVGPVGLNIARRWHARWGAVDRNQIQVQPLADSTGVHPFLHRLGKAVMVERMTIRMWMAISGAAVSSGAGRLTGAAFSLLVTLGNFRLGYWWDSGISTGDRANTPIRNTILEIWKQWLMRLLTTQSLLIAELRGRFGGPWRQYIYLSDGGHFENSGAYELLRRRMPLIVVVDGGQDLKGHSIGLGELMRISRIDFGCEHTIIQPNDMASLGVPANVIDLLGTAPDLVHNEQGRANRHATLIKVTYPKWTGPGPDPWHGRQASWMLYVRLTVTGDEPIDIISYQARNPEFPNQTTLDQDFDEPQFESYRCLGEHIGRKLFS